MLDNKKTNRKQDILQSLAQMLEADLGERITTARLAKKVGVSEAALYRHFPSKARMYESLLDFCEESLFSRVSSISSGAQNGLEKCFLISTLVLNFSQKNAGISRLLTGEVLLGETMRLKERVSQLFERLETQLKQILRNEAIAAKESSVNSAAMAKIITSLIEGRVQQFVRSSFRNEPTTHWEQHWKLLTQGLES